jgi:hypothetical protein
MIGWSKMNANLHEVDSNGMLLDESVSTIFICPFGISLNKPVTCDDSIIKDSILIRFLYLIFFFYLSIVYGRIELPHRAS